MKEKFIECVMRFAHDAYGGDAIPSNEKSFAEVFDVLVKEGLIQQELSTENVQGNAVMTFVDSMLGAFESGFVEENTLTLAQLYRVAQHHVKDNYAIDTKNIVEEWGEDFAIECGLQINIAK